MRPQNERRACVGGELHGKIVEIPCRNGFSELPVGYILQQHRGPGYYLEVLAHLSVAYQGEYVIKEGMAIARKHPSKEET